jgi:cytoskeletal protein CcmA (bactofilin family)
MSFFGNRRQQAEPPPAPERTAQPRPAPPQQPVGFETVVGANCTIEGTLRSSANVRLDGAFTGTLEITGNVLVGETAKITADINAKNVSIAGAVRGNVSGKKVQLLRTGRIWGDITAAALTTEEGAFIDGKIAMVGNDPSRPEAGAPDGMPILDYPLADETAPERQSLPSDAKDHGDDNEIESSSQNNIAFDSNDEPAPDEKS